jgi:hypothetical protein
LSTAPTSTRFDAAPLFRVSLIFNGTLIIYAARGISSTARGRSPAG